MQYSICESAGVFRKRCVHDIWKMFDGEKFAYTEMIFSQDNYRRFRNVVKCNGIEWNIVNLKKTDKVNPLTYISPTTDWVGMVGINNFTFTNTLLSIYLSMHTTMICMILSNSLNNNCILIRQPLIPNT